MWEGNVVGKLQVAGCRLHVAGELVFIRSVVYTDAELDAPRRVGIAWQAVLTEESSVTTEIAKERGEFRVMTEKWVAQLAGSWFSRLHSVPKASV